MERKTYLDRCKAHAIAKGRGNPGSITVRWRNLTTFPEGYYLHYDATGAVIHTAVLVDANANAIYKVRLSEVDEA